LADKRRVDSLTIVIPAYNESGRLPSSLEKIVAWAQSQTITVDLLIVDDGSTDGTAEEAQKALADRLPLTILTNSPNRGKGFSVRRGMLQAQGDCALFTDADLSTPIEEADRLLAAIEEGADIAIGSRATEGAVIDVHQPWWREAAGKLFGILVGALILPGIRDSQCGFKCFRRETTQLLFAVQTLDGWAFDVEILLAARKYGFTVAQVPVHWANDPATKVRMLTDGPRMILDMVRAKWRHRGRPHS